MAAVDNLSPKVRITNKTFRLKKATKRLLAMQPFANTEQRVAFRHAMIEAQVAASVVFKGKESKDRS